MTGEELQAMRAAAGLTLDEVAGAIGVARTTLRKWEFGIHPITEDRIPPLLDALSKRRVAASKPIERTRTCVRCGEEKEIIRFPRDPKGRGGRSARCSGCKRTKADPWGSKVVINRPLSSARLDRLLERANVRYGP